MTRHVAFRTRDNGAEKMPRYAIVNNGLVVGVVNWDGAEVHPYGAAELRGPLPEGQALETCQVIRGGAV